MNKSRIEYVDHTWNPITGCRHECGYCYARKMAERFAGDVRLNKMAKKDYSLTAATDGGKDLYVLDKPMINETGKALVYPFGFEPTFHRYRIDILDTLKMGNNIFVGAMAEIFGEWVPTAWMDEIMDACLKRPQHNYLFLTKNPKRYEQYGVPTMLDNMWYGTSVTKNEELKRLEKLPLRCHVFVSIEPLLEDMEIEDSKIFKNIDWMIIGAETGRRKNKVIPRIEWIKKILDMAGSIPVFMKDSLIPIIGEKNMRREYPIELQKKDISSKMRKKLYGTCACCKSYQKKSDMITLLARSKRGEQPKQFAFMCKKCFQKFCEESGINLPKLENLEDTITF